MRRAILIPPEEVRIGDTIRFSRRDSVLVNKYHTITVRVCNILGKGVNWIAVGDCEETHSVEVVHLLNFCQAYPLELVRRPRPEGTTEQDALRATAKEVHRLADPITTLPFDAASNLHLILEAIEAYLIGKSEEPRG